MSRRPHPRRRKSKRRPLTLQPLENRRVMAAELPLGVTPADTTEFMLGTVTVTPVFLESDGSSASHNENWTEAEIDAVLEKIVDGANWWVETLERLGTRHELSFVIDDTYARTPVEVDHEPIKNVSNNYSEFVGDFLDFAGVNPILQLDDGIRAFNHSQRVKMGTDWAMSIFVVDSSEDADGFFPTGGSFRGAFAFAGSSYFVATSTRPVSTYTHELGHLFWAFDEYAGGSSYNATRGYYDAPNSNAVDNPTPGFAQEISIMADFDRLIAAYSARTSPESTLATIGWRDSDGNGIFDVLDVPLDLEGSGHFDSLTSTFNFVGSASSVTLPNQNSSGNQSDITLNKISRLEVSIDDGPWTTLQSPGTAVASFDVSVAVPPDFDRISFRVIDAVTGITSASLTGGRTSPLMNGLSLSGFAYLDSDEDNTHGSGEPLLSETIVRVLDENGGELRRGELDAGKTPVDQRDVDLETIEGITITGNTVATEDIARIIVDPILGDVPLIHLYDRQVRFWTPRLNDRIEMGATFEHATSYVEVDVVGLSQLHAYARVEAFDADGNRLDRVTTDIRNNENGSLDLGEQQTLSMSDPHGRIASITIFSHAGTMVGVAAIRHGVPAEIRTDVAGTFFLVNLPDGEYQIHALANQVTRQFDPQTVTILSGAVQGQPLSLGARVADSPWFNADLPEDVNQDGMVTAVDALQIINDLNLRGARTFSWNEVVGSRIDVSNDGTVSALDALRVINRLNTGVSQSEPVASSTPETQSVASRSEVHRDLDERVSPETIGIDEVLTQATKWVGSSSDATADGFAKFV